MGKEAKMRILLIRPETLGIFSYTNQIEHEPLEMEYIYTLMRQNGYEAEIYDRRFDYSSLRKKLFAYRPDVVCISGYITQQDLMMKLARKIKRLDAGIRVILGGSNVEINYRNYFVSEADFLYHLSGLDNLLKLVRRIEAEKAGEKEGTNPKADITYEDIDGICYRKDGEWVVNKKVVESPADLPIPDRSFFYRYRNKFRYTIFQPLALVKNSYSCKKKCTFCYCTNRNGGSYACRSVEQLVEEIASIDAPAIHITDDDFLVDREYLTRFIALLKERNIHKQYLIYGRADFIAGNEDIIRDFAEVGLALVMVGLEATNNASLDSYNKRTTVDQNEECIRILNRYNVIVAGLLIVTMDMQKKDFRELYEWMAKRPIIPTISVFTPMQGSLMYKDYQDKLVNRKVTKQDLFHCLMKPEHMSVFRFTMLYYRLSVKIAFHKRKERIYGSVNLFTAFLYILKVWAIKLKRLVAF